MGYALLWVEDLAFWLLLIAWAIAVGVRFRRRWRGGMLMAIVFGVPLFLWGGVALLFGATDVGGRMGSALFLPVASLFGAIVVGGLVLLVLGLRRDQTKYVRAASWSPRALALAALAALAVHTMTFWNLDLAVRQRMDAMRIEAGTLALAVSPPRVPDGENAAIYYQQAFEGGLLDQPPEGYEDWLATLGDTPETFDFDQPEFVAYMQRRGPLLALVRQASAMPQCTFNRDWGRPSFTMLLPETQNMRAAARDLKLEAHYRAAHGDLRGAAENVLALHRMAEHVAQEPLLVSLLVSYALDAIAVNTLEHLLRMHPFTSEDLAVLDGWRLTPANPRLQRAYRMEEAFALAMFNQVAEWREMDALGQQLGITSGWPPNVSAVYRVFFLSDDLADYREAMARIQRSVMLPYRERQRVLNDLETDRKNTPMGIVSRLLVPALGAVETASARHDAQQRLALVALAAQRYRGQHGGYPERLEDLTADGAVVLLKDPFSNEQLRLAARGEGIVIYSLGPNLQDDGGAAPDEQLQTGDIIFTLNPLPNAEK